MESKDIWQNLSNHHNDLKKLHLKELLKDKTRDSALLFEYDNMILDLSHSRLDS